MPSPVVAEKCVIDKDLREYNIALKNSRNFLRKYRELSLTAKHKLIEKWYKSTELYRNKLSSNNSQSRVLSWTYNGSLADLKFDLTKLDILFLIDGQVPVFHTRYWLDRLYNSSDGATNFRIANNVSRLPGIFGPTMGPQLEPVVPSFDAFYSAESSQVNKWVNSKFRKSDLVPMTVKVMSEKLRQYNP